MLSMRSYLLLVAMLFAVSSSYSQSTPVDTLLQGKEYKLPPLDTSLRSKATGYQVAKTDAQGNAGGKEFSYTLQFDALADFDAAQSRRADLQRRTGYAIQLVFDSPFYKLRAGSWAKKEDAEDQVRTLSEVNVQAFVVKIVNKN